MGCPPVRVDNPRALASGLSYVQVDKHGITNLYHLHQCKSCTSRVVHAKVGKGGIKAGILNHLADKWLLKANSPTEGRMAARGRYCCGICPVCGTCSSGMLCTRGVQ